MRTTIRFCWLLITGIGASISPVMGQTQHFPTVFEDTFESVAIQRAGVQAVMISCQLARHPDSAKQVLIGLPDLHFEQRWYEEYQFNAEGQVAVYRPFWDSTLTSRSSGFQSEKIRVAYPEIHFTYDEAGRKTAEVRVDTHLRKDTHRVEWKYKLDSLGRVLASMRYTDLSWVEIRYRYTETGAVKEKKKQWEGGELTTSYNWISAAERESETHLQDLVRLETEWYDAEQRIIARIRREFRSGLPEKVFPRETFVYNEEGLLAEHELPMGSGIDFHGTWPTATERIYYNPLGLIEKRIFQYGPWINTFTYAYSF